MKITVDHTEELIIRDIFKVPLDTLITNQALGGANLMWIDGVLIAFGGFAHTDKLDIDHADHGIVRWSILEYSFEMKQYSPILKTQQLNLEVSVYNMSYHPLFKQVAEFIKQHNK